MTTEIVDCHAHLVPAGFVADLAAGRQRFPNVEVRADGGSHTVSFAGGSPTRPIAPGLTDTERRSSWLTEQGVARQVVGGWLDVFGYQLPAVEGDEWAQVLTSSIVEEAATDPRLVTLGTVPLQDPERAAAALREYRRTGLPGIMIATRAGDRELDDDVYTPLWEAADETAAVVFLHPGFGAASPRYADFGLVNGLARLEDTTVTLARLLYRGVPARYPAMKLLVAHGGAALPYVLGRLARNHALDPDGTADPVESFARLFFDSVVFDPTALEFLVRKVGARRVLLGSDYPFPIGDLEPRNVAATADLKADDLDLVLGASAAEVFPGAAA